MTEAAASHGGSMLDAVSHLQQIPEVLDVPPRAEAMAIRQYGVTDSSKSLRQNCIHDVAHPNDLQVGC